MSVEAARMGESGSETIIFRHKRRRGSALRPSRLYIVMAGMSVRIMAGTSPRIHIIKSGSRG